MGTTSWVTPRVAPAPVREQRIGTVLLRKDTDEVPGASQPRHDPDPESTTESERVFVCVACEQMVARRRDRIEIGGRHEHTFLNPAGIVYRIGCFARAPGAAGIGALSHEHTWFSGFVWQVAVCHGCAEHLGWAFTSEGSRFFGLIVDRLRDG